MTSILVSNDVKSAHEGMVQQTRAFVEPGQDGEVQAPGGTIAMGGHSALEIGTGVGLAAFGHGQCLPIN
jgi:hypothetical protein